MMNSVLGKLHLFSILSLGSFVSGAVLLPVGAWCVFDRSSTAGVPVGGFVIQEQGRYFWLNKSSPPQETANPLEFGEHELTREQFLAFADYWPEPDAVIFFGGMLLSIPFLLYMLLVLKRWKKAGGRKEDLIGGRTGLNALGYWLPQEYNPRLLGVLGVGGILYWWLGITLAIMIGWFS